MNKYKQIILNKILDNLNYNIIKYKKLNINKHKVLKIE